MVASDDAADDAGLHLGLAGGGVDDGCAVAEVGVVDGRTTCEVPSKKASMMVV